MSWLNNKVLTISCISRKYLTMHLTPWALLGEHHFWLVHIIFTCSAKCFRMLYVSQTCTWDYIFSTPFLASRLKRNAKKYEYESGFTSSSLVQSKSGTREWNYLPPSNHQPAAIINSFLQVMVLICNIHMTFWVLQTINQTNHL